MSHLSLVSDNTLLSQIHRLAFNRVAFSDDEQASIIQNTPLDQLVLTNEQRKVRIDAEEEIETGLRPSLNNYDEGPFRLAIRSVGHSLTHSYLSFDIETIEVKPDVSIIKPEDYFSKSIVMLSFLDVFGEAIVKEIEKSQSLLRAARNGNNGDAVDFTERKLRDEARLLYNIAFNAKTALETAQDTYNKMLDDAHQAESNIVTLTKGPSPTEIQEREEMEAEALKNAQPKRMSKEAVSDSLASSLSASNAFYDALWKDMNDFFEPACRHIGEQIALGKMTMDQSHKGLQI